MHAQTQTKYFTPLPSFPLRHASCPSLCVLIDSCNRSIGTSTSAFQHLLAFTTIRHRIPGKTVAPQIFKPSQTNQVGRQKWPLAPTNAQTAPAIKTQLSSCVGPCFVDQSVSAHVWKCMRSTARQSSPRNPLSFCEFWWWMLPTKRIEPLPVTAAEGAKVKFGIILSLSKLQDDEASFTSFARPNQSRSMPYATICTT